MLPLRRLVFASIVILSAVLCAYGLWAASHPQVIVEWSTASELDTVGYNLFRSESTESPAVQINTDLIPASADPLTGGDYSYTDKAVSAGKTYSYWLEDVDAYGATGRNGPVEVRAGGFDWITWVVTLALALCGLVGLVIDLRRKQAADPFIMEVGGLRLEVRCSDQALVQSLRGRFKDFLSQGEPHLTLHLLTGERPGSGEGGPGIDRVIEEALRNGETSFSSPAYSGDFGLADGQARLSLASKDVLYDVEYFLRVLYALLVFDRDGVMFHGAGIDHRGRGYLFFGHSGAGKTTVAHCSTTDRVLNDDLVLLTPPGPGCPHWVVHATPFTNPTQYKGPGGKLSETSSPLSAFFRLVQDTQVYTEPLSPALALAEMVSNVPVIPLDRQRSPLVLDRLASLLADAPVYNLYFLPNPSFWAVIDALDYPAGG